MRITCVIHSLNGGGSERVMSGLASRLAVRGHSVSLITLDDAEHDRHAVAPPVTRRPLDVMGHSHGWWQRLAAFRRRRKAVREAVAADTPDVVLSFCDRTNLLVLAAAHGMRDDGGSQVPVVISERSDPRHQNMGRVGEWLRRRLYPRAAWTVALTESVASYLRELGSPRVEVIPSAVDPPPVRYDAAAAKVTKRIVGIGRLEKEKGFDRLIEAFGSLAEAFPDWSLKIMGEGSQRRELESMAAARGLETRVALPGWTQSTWDELATSTLFVLPSRYEGFPSALLEAMAVGVPSVAVDCESGPREIIRSGEDGLLVDNSVPGLIDGMQQMMQDASKRERLAARAPEVLDRFGWEPMVAAYEQLLTKAARSSQDFT